MKRYVIAAITCIALTVGVGPAAASGGLGGVVQTLTGTSQQNTNTAGDAIGVQRERDVAVERPEPDGLRRRRLDR